MILQLNLRFNKRISLNGLKIAIFGFRKTNATESKMVGSNGTMIAIRLVRSKLRKREEHSNTVHPVPEATTTVVLQPTTVTTTAPSTNGTNSAGVNAGQLQKVESTDPLAYRGQFLWQFPPQPAERCLYNNEQVSLHFASFSLFVRFRVFGWSTKMIRTSKRSFSTTFTQTRPL